jgi:hypothetical protein
MAAGERFGLLTKQLQGELVGMETQSFGFMGETLFQVGRQVECLGVGSICRRNNGAAG